MHVDSGQEICRNSLFLFLTGCLSYRNSYLGLRQVLSQDIFLRDKSCLSVQVYDRVIDSRIIYNMLDEQAWTQYINLDDPVIKKTLDVFENHAAFPKKPEPAKKRAAKKEKIAMANTPYNYSSLHHNNCMIANA